MDFRRALQRLFGQSEQSSEPEPQHEEPEDEPTPVYKVTDIVKAVGETMKAQGFKRKPRRFEREVEVGRQFVEFVSHRRAGDDYLSFRLYAGLYADDFLQQVSVGYPPNGIPHPLIWLEPWEIACRETGLPPKFEKGVYPTIPFEVRDERDLRRVCSEVDDLLLSPILLFLDQLLGMADLERALGLGMTTPQALGEGLLRVLKNGAEKWAFMDDFDVNLERVGLDPNHFRYGCRFVDK